MFTRGIKIERKKKKNNNYSPFCALKVVHLASQRGRKFEDVERGEKNYFSPWLGRDDDYQQPAIIAQLGAPKGEIQRGASLYDTAPCRDSRRISQAYVKRSIINTYMRRERERENRQVSINLFIALSSLLVNPRGCINVRSRLKVDPEPPLNDPREI